MTGNSTYSTLSVTTNAGSIWYELDVARWMTSFELSRLRYFSTAELADPAISGQAATPDGDRVPNLLKYYLGLPGRAPATQPIGSLLPLSGQSFWP